MCPVTEKWWTCECGTKLQLVWFGAAEAATNYTVSCPVCSRVSEHVVAPPIEIYRMNQRSGEWELLKITGHSEGESGRK